MQREGRFWIVKALILNVGLISRILSRDSAHPGSVSRADGFASDVLRCLLLSISPHDDARHSFNDSPVLSEPVIKLPRDGFEFKVRAALIPEIKVTMRRRKHNEAWREKALKA